MARGALNLRTRGDRVDFNADVPVPRAVAGDLSAAGARLRLTGQAPYPDLVRRRGDGAVSLRASLGGSRLALAGQRLDGAQFTAAFDGMSAGWMDSLTLAGKAQADLSAASATAGGGRVGAIRAQASAPDLRWSRKGGDTVSATARITAAVQDAAAGELRAPNALATFEGPIAFGAGGTALALKGAVSGRGAWTGLGAPAAADSAEIAAVKRAARAFSFQAPAVSVTVSKGATSFALAQPLRVRSAAGGQALLADRGGGAWRLTVAGGRLPKLEADVSRFALTDGGATATGRVKAALSVGPVQDGVLDASGTLRIADGAVSFAAGRCAAIKAGRLEFGANDVLNLAGQLCPANAPLLRLSGGDWRVAGLVQGGSVEVPFLQVVLKDAGGRIDAAQTRGRLNAAAAIGSAEVSDTAPSQRFRPLLVSGPARLAGDVWTGDLTFRTPAGQAIGQAKLAYDGRTGAGGVAIETGTLTFADGGLQPIQLSPLASAVGTPVEGQASFTGRFDWTAAGSTSSGVLDIPRLDFLSPAGRVTGLSADWPSPASPRSSPRRGRCCAPRASTPSRS